MSDFADAYGSWRNWCAEQERAKQARAERARWCVSLEGLETLPENRVQIADYYDMKYRTGAHPHAHANELAETLFVVSHELLAAKREVVRLRAEAAVAAAKR
jgi:hypothetical protein